MIDFDYWSPTYIAFGKGKEARTGELCRGHIPPLPLRKQVH
jgi:alcohol dehydrogenase YqhD (iron-dependent ADH family)